MLQLSASLARSHSPGGAVLPVEPMLYFLDEVYESDLALAPCAQMRRADAAHPSARDRPREASD